MKNDILYIVIPAYNEEDNIESVISDWYSVIDNKNDDSRVIVADFGSTDNTHNVLLKLKEEYPKIELLTTKKKEHGPKVISLYKHAIDRGADYIFQTDSDGQTSIKDFDEFWEKRNEYVAIFGNRISRGDGIARKFVENTVCLLLKIFFGVSIPDANAPFRLIETKTLKKYINKIPNDYELPNIMITTFFSYHKENIAFIPISFSERKGGVNSINIKKIIKIGIKSLKDFVYFRKNID